MSPPRTQQRTQPRQMEATVATPAVEVRHPGLRKRMRAEATAVPDRTGRGERSKRGRLVPPVHVPEAPRWKRTLAEATADMMAESAARRARIMRTPIGILSFSSRY